MRKLLIFGSLLLLLGCGWQMPHPVLGETRQGEPLVMTEIQETGSRKDVPAGVDPDDVIVVRTASGAAAYITKVPKKYLFSSQKYQVGLNEQASAEGMTAAMPKQPWYRWIIFAGIFLLVGLGIYFFDSLKRLIFFWRR